MPKTTPGTDNRVLQVCRLLNEHRVRYILAGGVAANLHGSVRSTKDVDVLVPKDLDNTTRLLEALSQLPYAVARELDAAQVIDKPVDILTVAWTVSYEQAEQTRELRTILGVEVPYLSRADLIESKQTGRAADLADIEALSIGGDDRND